MAFSMAASMGGYMAEKQREIIKIDIDNIIDDENNDFEVEGSTEIETKNDLLKDSIEQFGLLDPCTVRPAGDGKYKLISGHRRTLMHRRLAEEGKEKFRKVDCIIMDTDEMSAEQILLEANIPNRKISDWEKARAVERMTQIFEQRKAAGEEITGRRREHIAKALGMSTSAVGRMENINKNLAPEYKDELKNGSIGVSVADKLASKPAEEQKKIFDAKGAKVKLYDLQPEQKSEENKLIEKWIEPVSVKKKYGVKVEITIELMGPKQYRASILWDNKKAQRGGCTDVEGEYKTYYDARDAAIKCAATQDWVIAAALEDARLIKQPAQDESKKEIQPHVYSTKLNIPEKYGHVTIIIGERDGKYQGGYSATARDSAGGEGRHADAPWQKMHTCDTYEEAWKSAILTAKSWEWVAELIERVPTKGDTAAPADTETMIFARQDVINDLKKRQEIHNQMADIDHNEGNEQGEKNQRAVVDYYDELIAKIIAELDSMKGSDMFAE